MVGYTCLGNTSAQGVFEVTDMAVLKKNQPRSRVTKSIPLKQLWVHFNFHSDGSGMFVGILDFG